MKITDAFIFVKEVRDEGKGYFMVDDGGVEKEVGEYLFGLIKVLKPQHVLETGIYHGISSSYMGLALQENGYGQLDAVEYEAQHIQESKEKWNKLEISSLITSYLISSLDFRPDHKYQLIWLDTEPHLRFAELIRFFPYLEEGGFVGIHDLPRGMCQGNINPDHPEIESWPFGNLPEEIKQWERTGELVRLSFPNPRGMVFWYKRHKSDYANFS